MDTDEHRVRTNELLAFISVYRRPDLVFQQPAGAIERSERYTISYWDAAIVAAAEALNCETVYSEDLNNGQVYGGVRVVSPFVSARHA
jgi:predicted nucleic acid-binding protein